MLKIRGTMNLLFGVLLIQLLVFGRKTFLQLISYWNGRREFELHDKWILDYGDFVDQRSATQYIMKRAS